MTESSVGIEALIGKIYEGVLTRELERHNNMEILSKIKENCLSLKVCSDIKVIEDRALLIKGDAIKVLNAFPDRCITLSAADLPYGTTACEWDSLIPLNEMWRELKRICKLNSAMIFTAQQPFTWRLCASNPNDIRYELIWVKPNATSPYRAKYAPMKKHEDVLVFYREQPIYNPQMEIGKPYKWNSKRSGGKASNIVQKKETPINNMGTRYPGSILYINQERGLHPTQKPVALMEWIVRTYSNAGQIVLDFAMGSGTTGIAALKNNRLFIGVELDQQYFDIAVLRIEAML